MKRRARRRIDRQKSAVHYQKLETRKLLAGNVTAVFSGGTLTLTGDDAANQIALAASGQQLTISGTGTTINRSSAPLNLNGPFNQVNIWLRKGNDSVQVTGLTAFRGMTIDSGDGDDTIRLNGISSGDLSIDAGGGANTVEVRGTSTLRSTWLKLAGPGNVIGLENVRTGRDLSISGKWATANIATTGLDCQKDFQVGLGGGNDSLVMAGFTRIGGKCLINMGGGADFTALLPSRLDQTAQVGGNLVIDGAGGDDLICCDEKVSAASRVKVFGSAGTDSLFSPTGNLQQFSIENRVSTQPNQEFRRVLAALTGRGIDAESYGEVRLSVREDTQNLTVNDPSPTISVRWDDVAQAAVEQGRTGPTVASRIYAMVHTAMYDAWSAYDRPAKSTVNGDALQRPAAENTVANKTRAMSFAAYRVLVDLFPTQKERFDTMMTSLGYNPANTTTSTTDAAGIGNVMAARLLEIRHADGSNQLGDSPTGTAGVRYSDTTGYVPKNTADQVTNIQRWTPERVPVDATPGTEIRTQKYLTPHWGKVKPFSLASSSQFRPTNAPPNFLLVNGATVNYEAKTITLANSTVLPISKSLIGTVINPAFVNQFSELVTISANLTDKQKLVAEFWEDGPGTSFPPGTWMSMGQFISARDNHSIDDDAKMFFALGNAVMDAGIATWETKLHFDYARPVRAIRELGRLGLIGEYDAALGGFAVNAWVPGQGTKRILATNWLTYQTPGGDPSPPFPDFTSGHSAFSASAATVLRNFTGSDEFGGWVTIQPGKSRFEPGQTPSSAVRMEWPTFTAAALDAGMSRVYGGIHFQLANTEGTKLGRSVGTTVWNKALSYINGTAT